METKTKAINIPDLESMYEDVRDFVKKHQGEKGYIITDSDDWKKEPMNGLIYDDIEERNIDAQVKAIRVDPDFGEVQVILDYDFDKKYDDEMVSNAEVDEGNYGNWLDLKNCMNLQYVRTLFSIAENIEEYTC